jgi:hypothetical protein
MSLSRGMIEIKSRKNQDLMYASAIVLLSVIIKLLSVSGIVVKNVKTMSTAKLTSIT